MIIIINNMSSLTNKGLSITAIKLISRNMNIIESNKQTNLTLETNNKINESKFSSIKYEQNEIDYNFCYKYYDTQNIDTINKLALNGIKNITTLNSRFDSNFNWKSYSKFCPHLTDEILVKKHYIESLNQKNMNEQILNIIIIKTSNKPLDNIFFDINNYNIQISIISDKREDIEHYNIKNYTCKYDDQLNILNIILKNNKTKYFMIIYDHYIFEKNFITKILKDLNNLLDLNALLIVQNSIDVDIEQDNQIKTDYFRIKTDFLRKITEPYICILNNEIKQDFDYSMSEIGIILYINQLLNKYNSILATTDYSFKNINNINNKLIIKDIVLLFDLYMSNIENNIIDQYNNNQLVDINDPNNQVNDTNINNQVNDINTNNQVNDLINI
jgi:hypothetical protein